MNLVRKASHVGIVGKSGTGKTEYGTRYMVGCRHDRVFIFDHMSELGARLGNLAVVADSLDEILDLAKDMRIVVYDPAEEYPGQYDVALNVWAATIFQIAKVGADSGIEILAVVDELQKLVNTAITPVELKTLAQTGRKYGLDTLLLSQQPNRLPNELREQWTELVSFRLIDPRSLKSLEDLGAEIEGISNLEDLHYIWNDLQTSEVRRGKLAFGS